MKSFSLPAMVVILVAASPSLSMADGQPPAPGAMRAEHEEIIQDLTRYAAQGAPTAAAARNVLELMTPHLKREEELVFPLLALLPDISEGRFSGDMTSAIAAADRLRAERDALFDEHAEIQAAVGELILAGQDTSEQGIVDLAGRIAAHAMSEIEIVEPAAVLVGDTVRRQLAWSQ